MYPERFPKFEPQGCFGSARSRRRQLPHERRHVGPRRQLGDELLDLPLRKVAGAAEHRLPVLASEVRDQKRDPGEVQAAVSQHVEQGGVASGGTCHLDAQPGLRFGQMEALDTIREHRRARLAQVEAPLVHLGDVGDEVGLDTAGVVQDLRQAQEEDVVRERSQRCLGRSDPGGGRGRGRTVGGRRGCPAVGGRRGSPAVGG